MDVRYARLKTQQMALKGALIAASLPAKILEFCTDPLNKSVQAIKHLIIGDQQKQDFINNLLSHNDDGQWLQPDHAIHQIAHQISDQTGIKLRRIKLYPDPEFTGASVTFTPDNQAIILLDGNPLDLDESGTVFVGRDTAIQGLRKIQSIGQRIDEVTGNQNQTHNPEPPPEKGFLKNAWEKAACAVHDLMHSTHPTVDKRIDALERAFPVTAANPPSPPATQHFHQQNKNGGEVSPPFNPV